jgi:hypothetical protein
MIIDYIDIGLKSRRSVSQQRGANRKGEEHTSPTWVSGGKFLNAI